MHYDQVKITMLAVRNSKLLYLHMLAWVAMTRSFFTEVYFCAIL